MEAYKIIRPLSYVAEIFCIIPFSFDLSKNNVELFVPFHKSAFYYLRLLIILTTVIGSIVYKQVVVSIYDSKSAIGNGVEFAHYNCRLIGTVCCVLSINYRNGHVISFMNSLIHLKKYMNDVGVNVNYKKISSLSYTTLLILFAKMIIMEIPYYINNFYEDFVGILDFIIFNLPLLLIHIISLQWILYLALLKVYIKSLNGVLKTLRYRQCWVINDFNKKPAISPVEILKKCGNIYSKLCIQSKIINKAFAWQFLLILPGFFIEIVLKSFNICQTIKNKTSVEAVTVISDIIHFLVVLEIVLPCVSVKEESLKVADTLAKIDINYENDADFEEVVS